MNLRLLPEYGGRSWIEDKYLHGVPELLAEICRSSAAYDLHVKLDVYQTAKVPEYLAILLFEREIRWHILSDGVYHLLPPDADGILRSRTFPGLWLDAQALLAGDMTRVLGMLRRPRVDRFERHGASGTSRSSESTARPAIIGLP